MAFPIILILTSDLVSVINSRAKLYFHKEYKRLPALRLGVFFYMPYISTFAE